MQPQARLGRLKGKHGWPQVIVLLAATMLLRTGRSQVVVATGTIMGHVVCSDTRGPARFASVTLVPLVGPDLAAKGAKESDATQILHVEMTSLDGSFVIRDVKPGNYYVLAEKTGYRSPTQITRAQMNHPTDAIARLMAELLTPVSVAANRASTVEVRLIRGATLSGSVHFDDGAPDAGATLTLWRKEGASGWAAQSLSQLNPSGASVMTNDRGNFRFSGLAAGEYVIGVPLELTQIVVSRSDHSEGWSSTSGYKLVVYAPNSMRIKDAKPIKLGEGEDVDGAAIEIPLSTMHDVSGSLVADGSGRPINSGKVSLVFADDGTELASAEVSAEDERFHLLFVPEGAYRLLITGAAEVLRTEVPNSPPGTVPPTRTETKTLQRFGEAEQPLQVESNVVGLVVSVPPVKAEVISSAQTTP